MGDFQHLESRELQSARPDGTPSLYGIGRIEQRGSADESDNHLFPPDAVCLEVYLVGLTPHCRGTHVSGKKSEMPHLVDETGA